MTVDVYVYNLSDNIKERRFKIVSFKRKEKKTKHEYVRWTELGSSPLFMHAHDCTYKYKNFQYISYY